MRKKQMLALFMSLSLLAQGMLFSGWTKEYRGRACTDPDGNGRSAVCGDNRF